MKKLTPNQLGQLHTLLLRNGSNDALVHELLDHLACEVEGYLWRGYHFELALEKVAQEANLTAIKYLRETYQHDCAMSDEQLQNASLDDIVFEFRNKSYGAYDLRKAYPSALKKGFFGGIGIFCMLIAGTSGFMAGHWSYTSPMMLCWTTGVCCTIYAAWLWFVENEKRKAMTI
jgi:hypothetical protein